MNEAAITDAKNVTSNQNSISGDQIIIEHLADAVDCIRDAITTLGKLNKMESGEKFSCDSMRKLSEIAECLENKRGQFKIDNQSFSLNDFFSSLAAQ